MSPSRAKPYGAGRAKLSRRSRRKPFFPKEAVPFYFHCAPHKICNLRVRVAPHAVNFLKGRFIHRMRPPRRTPMARPLADCTDLEALTKRLAEGPITLYCGFDPDRRLAARRQSRAPARAAPLPARRPPPHRPGRRRHRHGRRSLRQIRRAQPAQTPSRSNTTSPASRCSSPASSTSTRAGNPARLVDNADWTAPVSASSISCATSGSTFPSTRCSPRTPCGPAWRTARAASATPSSATMLLQAFDFYHLRQALQLRTADRRLRPVGQHHRRHRSHPQEARRHRLGPGPSRCSPRPTAPSTARPPGRRRLARSEATSPTVLPVLREHRGRQRRRATCGSAHLPPPRGDRGSRGRNTPPIPAPAPAHKALATRGDHVWSTATGRLRRRAQGQQILFGGRVDRRHLRGNFQRRRRRGSRLQGSGAGEARRCRHRRCSTSSCTPASAPSKGQARKDIEGGGIYVNNVRVADIARSRHDRRPAVREIHSIAQRQAYLRGAERRTKQNLAHGGATSTGVPRLP
jgi:tyrosyl-tRNA synthetase